MGWKDAPLVSESPEWMKAPELPNSPSKSSYLKQLVSKIARPVMEVGGAIIGGGLGAGAASETVVGIPFGAAAGGALGMAAGKSAADILDTKLGLRNELKPEQVIPEIGSNLKHGVYGEATGLVGLRAAQGLKPVLLKGIEAVSPSNIKMPAIIERFLNKEGVDTALNREQLSNVAVNYHKKLAGTISALDKKASETLSSELDIPKSRIIELLEKTKSKFVGVSGKAISSEAESAIGTIDNTISKIKEINPLPGQAEQTKIVVGPDRILKEVKLPEVPGGANPNISQQQLKDIVKQHENINWSDPARDAKKSVRNVLDSVLKSTNKKYAEAMKPVAQNVRLEKLVERKFGLRYDPSRGTYATDATAGKWTPKLLEGKAPESSAALKALDKSVGGNLTEKVRLSNIKETFTGDKTTGSRMVLLGRSIGSVLGPGGSTVGALAGAMMDKAGGKVTAGMIDALRIATQNLASPLNPMTAGLLLRTIYSMSQKEENKK